MSCIFIALLDSPTLTSSWVLLLRFIPYGMTHDGEMKGTVTFVVGGVVVSILGFHS